MQTMSTKAPTIQRDPAIKFLCISEWFNNSLTPAYENYIPVGELHMHYTAWVNASKKWNKESLLTLPIFSKQLAVLLHANGWKYARVKQDGVRGYYGVLLADNSTN